MENANAAGVAANNATSGKQIISLSLRDARAVFCVVAELDLLRRKRFFIDQLKLAKVHTKRRRSGRSKSAGK